MAVNGHYVVISPTFGREEFAGVVALRAVRYPRFLIVWRISFTYLTYSYQRIGIMPIERSPAKSFLSFWVHVVLYSAAPFPPLSPASQPSF